MGSKYSKYGLYIDIFIYIHTHIDSLKGYLICTGLETLEQIGVQICRKQYSQ